ncbi:SGNH/GDSL hydrolase family protein [Desulfococcaceae bacterium OttesenSCG-928-F15]|nr:SGNH/GDSL hydrolase family protein [Desulfococcaceae bacterium OttesenSCG-928-F15]
MLHYYLAGIFLAPVFLLEGLWVRKITPRLPEPEGPRSGKKGSGAERKIFIMGDSAAAGVGVHRQEEALSGKLTETLSHDCQLVWKLDARTGMRSRELLREILDARFEKFDYALISIGVNDVTHGTGAEAWKKNIQSILELVERKFQVRKIFLTPIPPMHRFPALPQPLRWWIGKRAAFFNRIMEEIAQKNDCVELMHIEIPFEKRYMAEDGFHPSEAAYAIWGLAVAEAIGKFNGEKL